MEKKTIISFTGLSKSFSSESEEVVILKNIHAVVYKGEKVAIMGPSGSGKSTLLSLLAALDTPTQGDIVVCDKHIALLSEKEKSRYRNQHISIIFQSFELITPFTVLENVVAPLEIRGETGESARSRGEMILDRVGLLSKKDFLTKYLSGGEKQRVAIGRALASDSDIIFADEPTGSLDRETGKKVLNVLLEQVENFQKTLVIITHDIEVARLMDRVLEIKDGDLVQKDLHEHTP